MWGSAQGIHFELFNCQIISNEIESLTYAGFGDVPKIPRERTAFVQAIPRTSSQMYDE
jgi:hypothetical protein